MPHDPHAPEASFYADTYIFRWDDGLEVHLEKFKEGSDSFGALLACYFREDVTDTEPFVVRPGSRVNLHAERTVSGTATGLVARCKRYASHGVPIISKDVWEARLDHVVHKAWERYQEGESKLIRVADVKLDYEQPPYLLPPLVGDRGVTIEYGDGSVGKSMVVAAQLLTIATGVPVLGLKPRRVGAVGYFDWEDNVQTIRERIEAMCAGLEIPVPDNIYYREVDRPIVSSENRIRREIEEFEIIAAAFDSMGMMLNGDPSDVALVIPAVNVMKRTGIACIGLHHLSAQQAASSDLKDKQKPYGSIYARTGARKQWLIERFQDEGASEGTIYMFNTKVNRGPKTKPLSWTVEYENGANDYLARLRYSPRSADDYFDRVRAEAPADRLTIPDLTLLTLERMGSWYTVAGLHARMEQDGKECGEQSVRNALNALVKKGLVTSRGEGRDRQFIASSRYSQRPEDL